MPAVPPPPFPRSNSDPTRVRALFAAPPRVAGSDFFRREISARMQERLGLLKMIPQVVLDAGCGEGDDVLALGQRYPHAHRIGVDSASAMLDVARKKNERTDGAFRRGVKKFWGASSRVAWRCEDFSAMRLPDNTIDLLWSNLALHWHPHPEKAIEEWQRVLRIEGALLFSCFGPDTFREVRRAFATVDDGLHTLVFADMHDLGDALVQAGFAAPIMDRETITLTYENATDLIADVRAFGGNPLTQRRRGLLSRAQGMRVMQALEAQRSPAGVIPLTIEVVYGHAFKMPPVRPSADSDEAVIRVMPRR